MEQKITGDNNKQIHIGKQKANKIINRFELTDEQLKSVVEALQAQMKVSYDGIAPLLVLAVKQTIAEAYQKQLSVNPDVEELIIDSEEFKRKASDIDAILRNTDDVKREIEALKRDYEEKIKDTYLICQKNLEYNLHDALNAEISKEHINFDEILSLCHQLKLIAADDFLANLCKVAIVGTPQELIAVASEADCVNNTQYLNAAAQLLIKVLKPETVQAVSLFIEKIGNINPQLHENLATQLSESVECFGEGTYDVTLPRDIFVAYHSPDIDKVAKLVDYLEGQEKRTCFVSYRNLKHGLGSRLLYENDIKKAIDSCTIFLFVSSSSSRFAGDARNMELDYVKNRDFENATPEIKARRAYEKIAIEHKKPRVEYLIESYGNKNCEVKVKDFFKGFSYCESYEAVAQAVAEILDGVKFSDDGVSKTLNDDKAEPVNNVKAEKDVAAHEDAEYQFEMGNKYFDGEGVEKSDAEAVKWWRKAAEQGHAGAQNSLGECYYNGQGVEQNYTEAVKWYKKAAEQGLAEAQYNLGECYCFGEGVEKNYAEAVKWYENSARQEYKEAQNSLGECYSHGWGVEQSDAEAIKWYEKAAWRGYAKAQFNLGVCYYYGEGVEKNYTEAVEWYKEAAEKGHAYSQYELGNSYYYGNGVEQNYAEAAKWYKMAAEQGLVYAQHKLGDCYYYGEGVEQSYAEAAKWYKKAAEQGYANARNNLGVCYKNGRGVEQNYTEAVKWYKMAAEQGNAEAQYNLGICYENGQGVKRSYVEAAKWYKKAAECGNESARKALENKKLIKALKKLNAD